LNVTVTLTDPLDVEAAVRTHCSDAARAREAELLLS